MISFVYILIGLALIWMAATGKTMDVIGAIFNTSSSNNSRGGNGGSGANST